MNGSSEYHDGQMTWVELGELGEVVVEDRV